MFNALVTCFQPQEPCSHRGAFTFRVNTDGFADALIPSAIVTFHTGSKDATDDTLHLTRNRRGVITQLKSKEILSTRRGFRGGH